MGKHGPCCDHVCCRMSLFVHGVFIMADFVHTLQLGFDCISRLCKEFEHESCSLIVFVKLLSFVF